MLNAYLYYKATVDKAYESFLKSVKKEYEENKFMQRGIAYEESINLGNEGQLSELIMPLKKQGWLPNKFVNIDENYRLKFNAKYDALDEENGILYDIKRVDHFLPERYTDENTVQHLLYFYLYPKAKTFYYLVAEGPDDNVKEVHVVEIKRPQEDVLEQKILEVVNNLFSFLVQEGLWDTFVSNHTDKYSK